MPHPAHGQRYIYVFLTCELLNRDEVIPERALLEPAGNHPALIARGKQAGEAPAFKGWRQERIKTLDLQDSLWGHMLLR